MKITENTYQNYGHLSPNAQQKVNNLTNEIHSTQLESETNKSKNSTLNVQDIVSVQSQSESSLMKTLITTEGKQLSVSYSPEDKKVSAAIMNNDGRVIEIKNEDMPKGLNCITDPSTFHAFLKDVYARTVTLSDGSSKLYLNQRGLGGNKLNINKINELINSGYGKIAQQFDKPEDVVVVIGATGNGKSTLINYLAGAKLKGENHHGNIRVSTENQLESIKIGHGASETRTPNRWKDETSGLVYWDCPGFGDTGSKETTGTEQEIVNAFFIKQLFEKATEKFKIVVTIKYSEILDRAKGLKESITSLDKLLGGTKKAIDTKCISLVVTKVPQNITIENVKSTLIKAAEMNDRGDHVKNLINDLVNTPRISIFQVPEGTDLLNSNNRGRILESINESRGTSLNGDKVGIVISDEATIDVMESSLELLQSYADSIEGITKEISILISVDKSTKDDLKKILTSIESKDIKSLKTFDELTGSVKEMLKLLPISKGKDGDLKSIVATTDFLKFIKELGGTFEVEKMLRPNIENLQSKIKESLNTKIKDLEEAEKKAEAKKSEGSDIGLALIKAGGEILSKGLDTAMTLGGKAIDNKRANTDAQRFAYSIPQQLHVNSQKVPPAPSNNYTKLETGQKVEEKPKSSENS